MLIATFNVNGINARMKALIDWLTQAQPDVALLQEIKSAEEAFPGEPFRDLGYNVAVHGQKGFNGVAILSKLQIEDVRRGLPGDGNDEQARWIEATVVNRKAIRVCCLYLPNGNPTPGPKYQYKLSWMERLRLRARTLLDSEEPALMAGDYNVIPQAEDAAKPESWEADALYLQETRDAFRRIVNLGFTEAFRAREQAHGHYTFWDYQGGARRRNHGIRIDHFLLTPQAADMMIGCHIDEHVRDLEKPSDHVPVVVELDA
ncbi:MAG: exodeoxyribonuclease III [Rhodobacter sp.]|nr:exodeoxyribonuclease III [Rhodobacter sp.]MCY4169700.1 exodeoxyribonuclease III [Rhodobacter sp.]MCY4240655.1 exodeoxyribonuclease III [Rhodobacter sp.]